MGRQEALDIYHASSMVEKSAELRGKHDLHMEMKRYVSDGNRMPESDRRFIRE